MTGPGPDTLSSLPIDAAGYRPHPLHATERIWTETNCYVDLWIEVLHSLGLDPVAGAAFTLSTEFEGDQWTFFKYPPEDLRLLYGVEVSEINVWRPVVDHVAEHLAMGNLLTVEVDSWFLPDTRGVSYRSTHAKTTIVPRMLDRAAARLGYFHNAGYFELEGEDFAGVFRLGAHEDLSVLPPYTELVRIDRIRRDEPDLPIRAVALAREHLGRRRPGSPVGRFRRRVLDDLVWLRDQDLDTFHAYAFGTCRQFGASAELAASFVDWLGAHGEPGLQSAAAGFRDAATAAKSLQFVLARVVRGKDVDVEGPFVAMEEGWTGATDVLAGRYGD